MHAERERIEEGNDEAQPESEKARRKTPKPKARTLRLRRITK